MADRVELQFRRAASRLIAPGSRVLAAVSGGADSVALLYLLAGLAGRGHIALGVAHLDHGLRPDSSLDRRFVERLAGELDLLCLWERRDVAAERRRDESPEEAARRVRRTFLVRAARQSGAALVATGHHLDDQAETVLMRLVRGAGSTALTGMAPAGPGPFVRPLLDIERGRLRDYLARRGIPHRDDPTNEDPRFDRNRVRRLLMPALHRHLNPAAARHLVRAAAHFRQDALFLDEMALELFDRRAGNDTDRGQALDVALLADQPAVLAARLARLALQSAGADPRRISSRHVEALLDLARGGRGRRLDLPGGLEARRCDRRIRFLRRADLVSLAHAPEQRDPDR